MKKTKFMTTFLQRRPDAHKYDFGRVVVIAGSRGMSGAAGLCAEAALRSGCGLVTVACPEEIQPIVAGGLREALTVPLPQTKNGSLARTAVAPLLQVCGRAQAVAIGPGLSTDAAVRQVIRQVVRRSSAPMVIDADAITAFAGGPEPLRRRTGPAVMTPHAGECARLLGLSAEEVQKNRLSLAKRVAAEYNVITVLKGSATIVASPQGMVEENTRCGNPGMATAGSGDVLTGIIAGFLAQAAAPWEAARLAVFVHARAGDIGARRVGMVSLLASDILAALPQAINELG